MSNLYELFNIVNNKINLCNDLSECTIDLEIYNGNDWKEYIIKNYNYHKHLVYKNDKLELYIITWMPNASTRIHDHPDKGCLVKVLQGELIETEFINETSIIYKNTNILKKDDIGFKIKNDILHKINNNTQYIVVSLHIYSLADFKITYY